MRIAYFLLLWIMLIGILAGCGDVKPPSLVKSSTIIFQTEAIVSPTHKPQNTATPNPNPSIALSSKTLTPFLSNTQIHQYPKMVPTAYSPYIGIIVPPYPEETEYAGGWLMGGAEPSVFGERDFAISLVKMEDTLTLWFKKTIDKNSQKTKWIVLDILVLPVLEQREVLIPDGCLKNQEYDGEIITIGILDDEAYLSRYLSNSKIQVAWRANREKQAFEIIPTDGIECYADMAYHYE